MKQQSLDDSISDYNMVYYLSPLLRSTVQKKMMPFKILLLIDNVPGLSRALMEMLNEINVVIMPASTIIIEVHGSRSSFDFQVSFFKEYRL